MLMPGVSGVAIDTLLFSRVGSPLCHRYRLISHTGSHTAFRGTYPKRLWSFIEEMDSAGRRQGPHGLNQRVSARMVKSTDKSVSRGRRPRRLMYYLPQTASGCQQRMSTRVRRLLRHQVWGEVMGDLRRINFRWATCRESSELVSSFWWSSSSSSPSLPWGTADNSSPSFSPNRVKEGQSQISPSEDSLLNVSPLSPIEPNREN